MAKKQQPYTVHDMWKNGDKTEDFDFKVPGSNEVGNLKTPSQQLAEKFRDLKVHASKNLVAMAILAHATREENLDLKKNYKKEFHEWYNKYNMDKVFGTKSNFSKYADAGSVITHIKDKIKDKLHQLPIKISALVAISTMDEDEIKRALEDHYIKDPKDHTVIKTKSKKPQPVINPEATTSSILSWLKNWRNPPVPNTEKRRLPFITIYADGSIYDFDKEGNFSGKTTVEDLEKISKQIEKIIGDNNIHARIESKCSDIKNNHTKRKQRALDAASKKNTRK
jgi:hypothetical protein